MPKPGMTKTVSSFLLSIEKHTFVHHFLNGLVEINTTGQDILTLLYLSTAFQCKDKPSTAAAKVLLVWPFTGRKKLCICTTNNCRKKKSVFYCTCFT